MKLLAKTKKGSRTAYTIQLSGSEFNFLRMCFSTVINSAGTKQVTEVTPYSENTITRIGDDLTEISRADPTEPLN